LGLTLLPRFVKMPDVADMALTVVGSQMTTKIWDYVERKMAPAATAVYAPAELPSSPAPAPTPPPASVPAAETQAEYGVTATQPATQKPLEKRGRYQVTG